MILQLFAEGFCLFSYDGIIIEETYLTISGLAIFLGVCTRKVESCLKKKDKLDNHELLFEEGIP